MKYFSISLPCDECEMRGHSLVDLQAPMGLSSPSWSGSIGVLTPVISCHLILHLQFYIIWNVFEVFDSIWRNKRITT